MIHIISLGAGVQSSTMALMREWQRMKVETPAEFADAVEFDAAIRIRAGLNDPAFLHSSRTPLSEVAFQDDRQIDLWGQECEGMCGL